MAMRKLFGFAPIVVGVVVGLLALVPVSTAAIVSDAAKACGADGNKVQAERELEAARDVWQILPGLGISPELEVDDRPAKLIVFEGPYDPSGIHFVGADVPQRLDRVICVIQADGTVNLYTDVSRDGSTFVD